MKASIFAAMASARLVMNADTPVGFRLGGAWCFGHARPVAAC
jgi:hypothetical protein